MSHQSHLQLRPWTYSAQKNTVTVKNDFAHAMTTFSLNFQFFSEFPFFFGLQQCLKKTCTLKSPCVVHIRNVYTLPWVHASKQMVKICCLYTSIFLLQNQTCSKAIMLTYTASVLYETNNNLLSEPIFPTRFTFFVV